MRTNLIEKPSAKHSVLSRLIELILVFAFIVIGISVVRNLTKKEINFSDNVANQIASEMSESHIVLSSGSGRRTVADFKEPIIVSHGKESRLIVHTAQLQETISIASEGLGGWGWTSAYQDIVFEGDAQYTVDLSRLTEEDFVVNNELKILTVRIPYAVLSPINIPDSQIKFMDVKKGWAAPKDIKMTPEENAQLRSQVNERMKAKLIDDNIIADANKHAKLVVADILSATVHSIDPDFTVFVVQ